MLKEIQMTLDEVLSISPAQAQIVRIKDSMKTPGSDRLTSYSIEGMSWTVISSNIKQSEECPNGVPRYQPQFCLKSWRNTSSQKTAKLP